MPGKARDVKRGEIPIEALTMIKHSTESFFALSSKDNVIEEEISKRLAIDLALLCVRNTFIEDLHSGTYPSSQTGDYSDVKIVTPYGEIPWCKASRISDDEMCCLMKEVVNKIYTVLQRLDDQQIFECMDQYAHRMTRKWDSPQYLEDWFRETAGASDLKP
jgi:hypothetical protein